MTYPTPEAAWPLPSMGGAGLNFISPAMAVWLDQTNAAGGANGTPVPACQGAPLPVQVIGGSSGSTFTDASVAPDGANAAQPTSATQLGFWNGTGYVAAQTGAGLPVSDSANAAWQGVVQITPGGASVAPGRGMAFYCTAAGTLTMTLANGSTMAFPIAASASLQTLGFAVTAVALSGGAAGTFWGLV